jgi:hypothetical protein
MELATIEEVDAKTWTVTVSTVLSNKLYRGVQIGSAYLNSTNGAMLGALPEVGSVGYILTGEGETQKVLSYYSTPFNHSEHFKAGRPEINPGDIVMRGTSGNEVIVRRGDVITISAGTGLAMRTYTGKDNSIKDICGNYTLETSGGYMKWGTDNLNPSPTGVSPTYLKAEFRKADGLDSTIMIDIGTIIDDALQQIKVRVLDLLGTELYKSTVDVTGKSIETCTSKKIESTGTLTLGNIEILTTTGHVKLGAVGSTNFEQAILGSFLTSEYANHFHSGPYATLVESDPAIIARLLAYLSSVVYIGD